MNRCYNNDKGISNYGHAMFAKNYTHEGLRHYGEYKFELDTTNSRDIMDLKQIIIDELNNYAFDLISTMDLSDDLYDLSDKELVEEIFESYNCKDIVDSANAWDNKNMVVWFCENICQKYDFYTIITADGAITFDPDMVKFVGKFE